MAEAVCPLEDMRWAMLYGHWLEQLREPGRIGLTAAEHLLRTVPPQEQGELLRRAWEQGPDRLVWISLLSAVWRQNGGHVLPRVTRAQAITWWRYADYDAPLPWAYRVVLGHREQLPDRITLYRGGLGEPAFVAGGLCWTPHREVAGFYALARWRFLGRQGEPFVIRAEVPREAIIWQWTDDDGETLVDDCGSWRLHVVDLGELHALDAVCDARCAANTAAVTARLTAGEPAAADGG